MKSWEVNYLKDLLKDGEVYPVGASYQMMVFKDRIMVALPERTEKPDFLLSKPDFPKDPDGCERYWWGFTDEKLGVEK